MNIIDRIKGLLYRPEGPGLVLEPPHILESMPRHELFAAGVGTEKPWYNYAPPFRYQGSSMWCTAFAGTNVASMLDAYERGGQTLFSPLELFYRSNGSLKGNYLSNVAIEMAKTLVLERDVPTPVPTYWNNEAYTRYYKLSKASDSQLIFGEQFKVKSFANVIPTDQNIRNALTYSPLMVAIGLGKNYWDPVSPKVSEYNYYHAVSLLGFDQDGNKIVFESLTNHQGFDGFKRLAPDYEILSAFSFIDLPNNWKDIQLTETQEPVRNALNHYGQRRNLMEEQLWASKLSDELRKHPTLRSYFGREWTIAVNALTYGDYTIIDLLNHYTSIRRGQGGIFNLNQPKK